MAGNIAGMFKMINNAVQNNPIGGEAGANLLGGASQGAANMLSQAPGMEEVDPMSMMNDRAKEMETTKQLAQVDLTTAEGLAQAAQIYQQSGDMMKAMELLQKSKEMKQAEQAKNNAMLDAANEGIQENLVKTQENAKKVKTAAYARKSGATPEQAQAIRDGLLDPDAYMAHSMKEKELFELSKGEALVDKEGNVLHLNPDLTASNRNKDPGEITANINIWRDSNLQAEQAARESSKIDGLIGSMQNVDVGAGYAQSAEDWALTALGQRDDPQFLRTQAMNIINNQAIASLPPGPASDKDIEIMRSGFPDPKTASKEELIEYLESASKLSKRISQYERMKGQHAIEGNHENFQANWEAFMAKENHDAAVAEIPSASISWLKENNTPENRDAFRVKYGINPVELGI